MIIIMKKGFDIDETISKTQYFYITTIAGQILVKQFYIS